ncbi:U3 small nucleolar RNA-associated protein 11 [Meloidogyne graminicola]|uniref:U3 small nucleolar RNA-associated protein 11 n=1 Tax=Meloidogyne graminicola TaxID=189291 RepID=A0A8S9ZGI8_9BILA|nr:U3 small nucleolar RNA-associated protein 11 [Meloidogyne graminicola]
MPGISKIKAGHLEKRKEWIRRTRDYKQKADAIKNLKVKARERNSDEFNFHMLRSQVGLDGVHRDMESDDEEQTEVQHLLSEITDINYVKFQLQKERKKIERLKSVLHFCTELGIKSSAGNSRSKSLTPVNKHIIFVNNKEQVKKFDLAKHFDTSDQFISRTFNRPRISSNNSQNSLINEDAVYKLEETEKERRSLYTELGKRIEREKELSVVLAKLELKRDLQLSKGSELKPKRIRKGNAQRAAVYKWTYERKK